MRKITKRNKRIREKYSKLRCQCWSLWPRVAILILLCPYSVYGISMGFVAVYGILPEKAMATHSSTLAWKIPWMKEPGRLQSMGSRRVGHDWATSLSLFTFMHWRRKWQPTSLFFSGESQGRWGLVGCRLWGRTESDTTEATQQQQQHGILQARTVEWVAISSSRASSLARD